MIHRVLQLLCTGSKAWTLAGCLHTYTVLQLLIQQGQLLPTSCMLLLQ